MSNSNSGDSIPPYLNKFWEQTSPYNLEIPRQINRSSSAAATEAGEEREFNKMDSYPDNVPRGVPRSTSVAGTDGSDDAVERTTGKGKQAEQTSTSPAATADPENTKEGSTETPAPEKAAERLPVIRATWKGIPDTRTFTEDNTNDSERPPMIKAIGRWKAITATRTSAEGNTDGSERLPVIKAIGRWREKKNNVGEASDSKSGDDGKPLK